MREVTITLPKKTLIKRIRAKGNVVAAGTVNGDGMILSVEGQLLKNVKVGNLVTAVSVGEKYLFGSRDLVVIVNGRIEYHKFKGVPLSSHEDYLVTFYEGGGRSKAVNLREFYAFEVEDVVKSIATLNGLAVLGGKKGIHIYEKSERLIIVPIEEVVGVVAINDSLYALSRDPFFANVSYLHKFEVTGGNSLKHVKRVELSGLAYDLSSNGKLLAASTGQGTYVLDEELKRIYVFEKSVSSAVGEKAVCLTDGKALKCRLLENLK